MFTIKIITQYINTIIQYDIMIVYLNLYARLNEDSV